MSGLDESSKNCSMPKNFLFFFLVQNTNLFWHENRKRRFFLPRDISFFFLLLFQFWKTESARIKRTLVESAESSSLVYYGWFFKWFSIFLPLAVSPQKRARPTWGNKWSTFFPCTYVFSEGKISHNFLEYDSAAKIKLCRKFAMADALVSAELSKVQDQF